MMPDRKEDQESGWWGSLVQEMDSHLFLTLKKWFIVDFTVCFLLDAKTLQIIKLKRKHYKSFPKDEKEGEALPD